MAWHNRKALEKFDAEIRKETIKKPEFIKEYKENKKLFESKEAYIERRQKEIAEEISREYDRNWTGSGM